jgi:hypothetical protein
MKKIIPILIGIILAANTNVFSQSEQTLETVYVTATIDNSGNLPPVTVVGSNNDYSAYDTYWQIYYQNQNNNDNDDSDEEDNSEQEQTQTTQEDQPPVDCAGVAGGSAVPSDCGCIGGTTGINQCIACDHQPFNPGDAGITTYSGGQYSITLSPYSTSDYGLTNTEKVTINIGACMENGNWYAVLTGITGHYSKQVQLAYGVNEVSGINTMPSTFCRQVEDLKSLAHKSGMEWYMLSAVEAHENVHLAHFEPAIEEITFTIEAQVEALSVPNTGQTEAEAIEQIKRLQAFITAESSALTAWDSKVVTMLLYDHVPGGPADMAESAIVLPMAESICTLAIGSNWGPCGYCY